jgi:hypothetical protein
MADDDGTTPPPEPDPPAGIDRDDLKAAIREVLAELPGFGGDGAKVPEPDDDDLGDAPTLSVKQAEDIAEQAVRRAMKTLQANAKPPSKPRPKSDDDGTGGTTGASGSGGGSGSHTEPPPTPPQTDYKATLRKILGV